MKQHSYDGDFHMDQTGILIQWTWLGKLQKQVAKQMCC